MQRNIKKEFQLGVLFVVAVIFLAGVTISISRLELLKDYQYIKVIFPEVLGLKKGDPVRVSGVSMGQVDRIKYIPDTRVRVVLRLEEPITLWEDYVIGVGESSMLGGYYISIKPGTNTKPKITNLKEPLNGKVMLPGLTVFGRFVEENQDDVKELLIGAIKIVKDVSAGKGSLGKFVTEDTLYNDLKETNNLVKGLLKDANEGKGTIGRLLKEEKLYNEVEDIVKTMKSAADTLKESSESMNKTLKHIEEGKGPIGKVIYDEKLSRQITEAGDSVNKILGPVVRTKVYAGAEGKYYLDSKSTISKLYIRIEPRESRYFLLGGSFLSFDNDGTVDFKDKSNGRNRTLVKVDLLTGYKFFNDKLSARLGLFEGKFGGGLDWQLPISGSFISRVTLSLEGRDGYNSLTREGIDENLKSAMGRAYATVSFGNHIKFYAGASRLFNDNPELFGGLCFEYLDEDIRNFVTLIGLSK